MADEATGTEVTQEKGTQGFTEDKQTADKGQERLFTQGELDKVIAERLARERAKLPGAEKLKAFEEWQRSQQTEAEKAAEREKEFQAQRARNVDLERELAVIRAGVKAGDAEYVVYKVGKMEGDFGDNLKVFLAENVKFTEPETAKVEGLKHKAPMSVDAGDKAAEAARKAAGLR